MKRVFISQPMRGKSDEKIKEERDLAIKKIKRIYGEDVVVIDSFVKEEAPDNTNVPLWCLSRSIRLLSDADIAYFITGWGDFRGCQIEEICCREYGIPMIKEDELPGCCCENYETSRCSKDPVSDC